MTPKLLSRKEVYSQLGISESTLRRKLQEFNINCVNEVLPNGVISSKITYEDFLKISEVCRKQNTSNTGAKPHIIDMPTLLNIKTELVKAQTNLMQTKNIIKEKDSIIQHLQNEKLEIEEKNHILFDQFMETNNKYLDALIKIKNLQNKLLEAENAKSLSFFHRISNRIPFTRR